MDIYIICHRIVVTEELRLEWDQHHSRFFIMWLSWMKKKSKLCYFDDCRRSDLRDAIVAVDIGDAERAAMLDDFHLIEGGLAADRRVVSLDREARGLFADVADLIVELASIEWLDPSLGDRPPGRR